MTGAEQGMVDRIGAALRALPWAGLREPLNVYDDAEDIARVALKAMLEPTEAMVEAMQHEFIKYRAGASLTECRATYASAITAALEAQDGSE